MAPPWRTFLLLVILFSLLSVDRAAAQPQGSAIVSSDLQLLSVTGAEGGGHVTWTFTGEQAELVRAKILGVFDSQLTIPRGFVYGERPTGATTSTVGNGVIDSGEAGAFLDDLELELEGTLRGYEGVEFRYFKLRASDRLERGLPPERSSSGLVGTTLTTNQSLTIQFIFDGRALGSAGSFFQAGDAFAQALHSVLSFDAQGTLQESGCPPRCYPFPARNGWRRVDSPTPASWPAGPFLWHGNLGATPWVDTGAYLDGASNATFYSPDGIVESTVDLRFASAANLTFEHTGGAATGDALIVQASADGVAWQAVTADDDLDGQPPVDAVLLTELRTSAFDLSPWLGNRVYVRLNFTTTNDSVMDGPGYYVRNFRIDAPSWYEGRLEQRHIDFVVGFLSFSNLRSTSVSPHLIRTPVGEIMFYYAAYEAGSAPQDTARFATFDGIENPQILFAVLLVSAWLIRFFQTRTYAKFRAKHPRSMRSMARRVWWPHWGGRGIVILLVLLYFFPTAFGANLFVSGLAYWSICILSIVGLSMFTWYWYARRAKLIPPEPTIGPGEIPSDEILPPPPEPAAEVPLRLICAHCDGDIESLADAYRCGCGQLYDAEHAALLQTCPNCGRPLVVAPPEKRMVTVRCPVCGDTNVVDADLDLALVKCGSCASVLKEIARGYNYLVVSEEPHAAYEWFRTVVKRGVRGLCMSTSFPEKVRRQYDLPEAELYWISDTSQGPKTVNPKRLDFEIMRSLSNFLKDNPGCAVVLDGLEYLIVENSFERVLKFIKKVNDLASVYEATMFVPVTLTGLGPEEMTLLKKEFDRVETIGA